MSVPPLVLAFDFNPQQITRNRSVTITLGSTPATRGGFDFFVEELKARFGLDFAFSNELEVQDGVITGRVHGSVVDGERKAQVLKDMAKVYKCRLEQTVAIGDGANDMLMLQAAGLGIAFRAKPKLQEVAHMSLNHHERLDTLLFLMGFSTRDIATVT